MPPPEGLTLLVADDEPPARRHLVERLQESGCAARILEVGDGREAVAAIRAHAPDLVFLDVQMPELTGIDVLREIGPDRMPPTVFVTAYDRHAIHAFDAGALDYLLKPFSDERFEIALARARRRLEDAELRRFGQEALRLLARSNARGEPSPNRLLVRTGTGTQVVTIDEIDAVVGAGVYVALRVRGLELLHRASLADLGAQLGERFVRVHRSSIVNLDAVVRLDALSHDEFELTLRHGERVRASRTYRAALERALGPLSWYGGPRVFRSHAFFPRRASDRRQPHRTSMHNISRRATLALGMSFAALSGHASSTASINVPLTAANWTTKGDVQFQNIEGFPNGLMVNKGGAILNTLVFKNGTIDVDVMLGKGISTIIFRRDDDMGEALVLRPQPNCPASNDCIQYTPVMHGAFLWDLYPRYQTKAPLSDKQWNHIRIVAAGKRMKVFMNGLSEPVLSVDRMAGTLGEGSLRLSGPASWANLVITPESKDGFSSTPAPEAPVPDHHLVRTWNVSPAVHVVTIVDKKLDGNIGTLPSSDVGDEPAWHWRHLVSEADGLVNLSREVGSSKKGDEVSGVWLSTIVRSDRDQTKHVHLGWVREIAVFANGKPVFQERNLYGSPAQKEPDGRLGLENGQFDLPLCKGDNTVRVFIDDNFGAAQHFGWGMKMRFDDIGGLHFQS